MLKLITILSLSIIANTVIQTQTNASENIYEPVVDFSAPSKIMFRDVDRQITNSINPTLNEKSLKVNLHNGQKTYGNPGFSISIPLSSNYIQDNLAFIILYISVAGQEHSFVYPPVPNQMVVFTWNGKDENGNKLNGTRKIKIHVGYKYQSNLSNIENDLIKNKNGSITIEKNKDSVIYWHSWTDQIGTWDSLRSIITLLDT